MDEFPHLTAWDDRMLARPGVEKGRHVPSPHREKEILKDKAAMDERVKIASTWILHEQAKDAK